MTGRVVDGPLDPAELAGEIPDPASGALVVIAEPAPEADGDAAGAGASAAAGGGQRDEGAEAGGEASAAARASGAARDRIDRELGDLEDEAVDRFGVRRCAVRVRPDAPPGQTAVAVAVRAPHRADAFETARRVAEAAARRLRASRDAPDRAGGDDGRSRPDGDGARSGSGTEDRAGP